MKGLNLRWVRAYYWKQLGKHDVNIFVPSIYVRTMRVYLLTGCPSVAMSIKRTALTVSRGEVLYSQLHGRTRVVTHRGSTMLKGTDYGLTEKSWIGIPGAFQALFEMDSFQWVNHQIPTVSCGTLLWLVARTYWLRRSSRRYICTENVPRFCARIKQMLFAGSVIFQIKFRIRVFLRTCVLQSFSLSEILAEQ